MNGHITDKLNNKSPISSPNPSNNSAVPYKIFDSDEDSTEQGDLVFSSSQLPYRPLRSSSSCDPQQGGLKLSPRPSSLSVSDMPPNLPPPPPPPHPRGNRGRGPPRGTGSGRGRPHQRVSSSTRSHSSSQLMKPKACNNNTPFNLSALALNPFPSLPTTTQPESSDILSPLQRKLHHKRFG